MNPVLPSNDSSIAVGGGGREGWMASALIYAAFSAAVFVVQGSQPPLGPDHLSYFQLADSIIASCPNGDFWRETDSIRLFGVLLAYLNRWTGSYVLSMKVVLAVFSVLYLLAAELFFRLFTNSRWQAILFALLSGFAVSFGFASWGVTDSTALLPRTLVAPIVMLSMWFWFRYDGRPQKYLVFAFLVLGSMLHLSTFYAVGVLVIVEAWDILVLKKMQADGLVTAFVGGLLLAAALLFSLEYAGISSKLISTWVPTMLRSIGLNVSYIDTGAPSGCNKAHKSIPAAATEPKAESSVALAPTNATDGSQVKPDTSKSTSKGAQLPNALKPPKVEELAPLAIPGAPVTAPLARSRDLALQSAKDAWAVELSLRPWRNMPLPLVNVANALSSSALILLLAFAGMVSAKRAGLTRVDRLMMAMFFAVPLFAFGPQTMLWVLRSFTPVYPATIEEVRSLSLIMIPALYFILRLFKRTVDNGGSLAPLKAGAIVIAVLALPLSMKSLPHWARGQILSAMMTLHVVDSMSAPRMANARAALGLLAGESPLYYATQGVRDWFVRTTPPGTRILTNRDDMILLRDRVILGPRQVSATTYGATLQETEIFLRTSQAMETNDTERVKELAASYDADFVLVAWRADGAVFADNNFSVIPVRKGQVPR